MGKQQNEMGIGIAGAKKKKNEMVLVWNGTCMDMHVSSSSYDVHVSSSSHTKHSYEMKLSILPPSLPPVYV